MSKFKAYENFENTKPLDLSEGLKKAGKGVAENPEFDDSPYTGPELIAAGELIIDTHNAKRGGNDKQKQQYKDAKADGVVKAGAMGKYANSKCGGVEANFIKLGVPYYDASTPGGHSSVISFEQGPNSGEIWMTVPVASKHESYIAMYSLTEDAPLSDCRLAGASTHCRFLLTDLPVTTKLFIRWATVTAAGIGAWSISYPVPVN